MPEPRTVEEALLHQLCVKGGVGGSFKINDASYLFYNGARLEAKDELLKTLASPTRADFMFCGCKDLKEVDISGIDWSQCTGMINAFQNSGLTRIDLTECNFASMIGGSTVFRFCNDLEEIIGVSFPQYRIMDDFFPKGTEDKHCKLKRLTFKPDVLSCGDVNISYCSMEREGAVELFKSLPDYSNVTGDDLPVQNYRRITLTGNPCVTGERETLEAIGIKAFDVSEIVDFMEQNDAESVEVRVYRDVRSYTTIGDFTIQEMRDQMFGEAEYIPEEEFPVEAIVMVPMTHECETITESDISIANAKGWVVVEA